MLHYLLIQGSFSDRKAFLCERIRFQVHFCSNKFEQAKYPSDIKNERLE